MAMKAVSLNQNKKTNSKNINTDISEIDNNSRLKNQCRNNKNCRNTKKRNGLLSSINRRKHENKLKKYSNIFRNKNYKNFIRENINYFQSTKNASQIVVSPLEKSRKIFKLEKNVGEDNHKIVPLNTDTNKIELVLNTSNLYVEGFINTDENNNKTYWYFSDANIKNIDNIVNSKSLEFSGNYTSLVNSKNIKITKNNITSSIDNLSKVNIKNKNKINKDDLVRTIFITSEAMRFFSVRDDIDKVLNSDSHEVEWRNHEDTLTKWNKYSKKHYERLKIGSGAETQEEHNKIFNVAILAPNE